VPFEKLKEQKNYKGRVLFKANENKCGQRIITGRHMGSFNDYAYYNMSASHGFEDLFVVKRMKWKLLRDGDSNMCYHY